ncbi:HAD family phosphatase [Seonamhaeicola sp.]|uniref:HAD family hydrolase n=1 Tax=Seonamhaeicola sp. TaxID=1912245 RepID=UPI00263894FD|nr:HAD family phosphatase [Seonamhaeicola sp.]
MSRIKNIIFDLGGVIMNLNVPETIKEFKRLGIVDIVNDTGHHYTDPIFYDFEIGKVSPIEFIEKLKSLSALTPSSHDIKEAWNAMILDMPKEKIRFLKELKRDYNIFLLSNTNSIHQEKFIDEVNRTNNMSFNNLFVKAYYSHEIGLRKPGNEAFCFLLRENNLKANETLFIDDSIDNIRSAEAVGIKGSLFKGGSLEKHVTDNIIK